MWKPVEIEPEKCCNRCGVTKKASQFKIDLTQVDGRYEICKPCARECGVLKRHAQAQAAKNRRAQKTKVSRPVTANQKMKQYQNGAEGRGFSFDLTLEQFETFWQKPCTYCGTAIATVGIDRVDSSLGYSLENCVSCCTTCNTMKLNRPLDGWLDHMKQILEHQGLI